MRELEARKIQKCSEAIYKSIISLPELVIYKIIIFLPHTTFSKGQQIYVFIQFNFERVQGTLINCLV